MEAQLLEVQKKLSKLDDCKEGLFKSCMNRDYAIVALAATVLILLWWLYENYDKIIKVAKMDNRPRSFMGGIRDDTGSHVNVPMQGLGHGLQMTANGAKTIEPGFDVAMGKSTYKDTKGHVQTEYEGWGVMEQAPAKVARAKVGPVASLAAKKEGFKGKHEKFADKVTEDGLRGHLE